MIYYHCYYLTQLSIEVVHYNGPKVMALMYAKQMQLHLLFLKKKKEKMQETLGRACKAGKIERVTYVGIF